MNNLTQDYNEFIDLYHSIKERVRKLHPHLYESWKAGGFLVDNQIVSMYPDLEKVIEIIGDDDEDTADNTDEE